MPPPFPIKTKPAAKNRPLPENGGADFPIITRASRPLAFDAGKVPVLPYRKFHCQTEKTI